MNKVIDKKVISIIIIFLILIVVLLVVANTFINNNLIKQAISKTFKQEDEKTILNGISCKALDNTGEKIKAFVTITRENGIEKIEYIASNEKNVVLNCNNKQKVTIDIEILVDEEKQFKVTSSGEEKIETVILNTHYIDDYIKITKLDNEEEHDKVDIEFTPVQASSNYYKINKGPWIQYSSILSLDLSDIDIEKLQSEENETTIYAKSVDVDGNTLISSKTIELTKKYPDFDLFHNMEISGKTNLTEYGISGYWNYAQNNGTGDHRNFSVRNMGVYFRQGGRFNYSASFTISNISAIKPIKANQLYFTAYHYAPDYPSRTYSSATIYYTDGTSQNTTTNSLDGKAGGGSVSRTFGNTTNLQDKPIDRIIFYVSGHRNAGGIQTNITGIILKGIK